MFASLVCLSKASLCHLKVHVPDASSTSAILTVLADKVDSLTYFSCNGPSPSLNLLRCFLHAQFQLKTIRLSGKYKCPVIPCHEEENDVSPSWVEVETACLENKSVVEIGCR